MIFRDMGFSIFKPAAYARFALERGGRALFYLVLIALPLALVGAVRVGIVLDLADAAARAVVDGPDFRVRDGVLEFDAPQPYELRVEGQFVGLVDTTGATNETYLANRNGILVLKDRVIIRNGRQLQTTRFADLGPQAEPLLSRQGFAGVLSMISDWAWGAAFLWLAGSIIGKIMAALVLSLGALVLIEMRGRAGGYRAAWGIACHALTLPLILSFVRVLVFADIVLFGLVYWGAAIVYVVAGTSILPERVPA